MVPEGWHSHRLGDLGGKEKPVIKAGPFGSSLKKEFYVQNGYKIYGQEQVISNDPFYGDYYIDENKYYSLKSCAVEPGDLLISLVGTFGNVLLIPDDAEPGIINPRLLRISPDKKKVSPKYLSYFFNHTETKRKLFRWAQGGTMGVLNAQSLKSLPINLPPYEEQIKISSILLIWDKAIEVTENLIKNSQAQKKALMQQLLTGKKRLSGFNGQWLKLKLYDICKFLKGKGLSKDSVDLNSNNKCILYGELYTYYKEVVVEVRSRTNLDDGIKSVSGDVLIPCSTTTSAIDLANAVSLNEDNVLLGGDINILRPNKNLINSDFLAYLLTHIYKFDIARLAQGITIIHLYGKDIKNIEIVIPSLGEQQRIVSIFKNIELTTNMLEEKLNKLKLEKKALMQQLLTGKRRVKVDIADEAVA